MASRPAWLFWVRGTLLSAIPWEKRPLPEIEIPPRQQDEGYVRPPTDLYTYVPDHAASLLKGSHGS